ncbi:uncharacterized protein (TIGR02300 family) [Hasllibacter halocynthiae]|uniref:Uncharacterized protein (TIGR02300 family) n=1 Tax=Hasllibacter halocynthiae TaxID=595589 RepID=A0A2T0X174_9RHOB|nr:TIGR02300 family protein [Hasllibacter halocynthiae]PRY92703.1 uncharacterized protein (TIGR02300 family) [Hasllibacter halocynthiae]
MPKEEWGVKRLCPACGERFYDLQNDPMTCPECGTQHTVESLMSGKVRHMQADKADPKSVSKEADDEEEVVLDDDDVLDEEEDAAAAADDDEDVLDDDDEDEVSLDELADVASKDGDDD